MIVLQNTFRSLVAASALTFATLAAHAATVNLKADIKGSSEVPAKDVAGTGTLTGTLDTDTNESKSSAD